MIRPYTIVLHKGTEVQLIAPHGERFWSAITPKGEHLVLHETDFMPTIPSRFAKSSFDRFASVIGEAVRVFPAPLTVDPSPLSVETFSARARDAIKSAFVYGHTHPSVDTAKLLKVGKQIVVAMRGDKVVFGPRDSLRTLSQAGTALAAATQRSEICLADDEQSIEAICAMLTKRCFNPVPEFFVTKLSPEQIASLEELYDILVIEENNKFYLRSP